LEKKLIVIIGSLEVGGTERHLLSILPQLKNHGWLITVVTLSKKGALAPLLEEQGVNVTSALMASDYKIIAKLPRLLGRLLRITLCVTRLASYLHREKKHRNSPLLHFYLPESYVLGMLAANLVWFSGSKIMSRRSLNNYQTRRPGVAWCEKRLHAKTALIIGNSRAIIAQLKEKEGVPETRLRLIYNGVDMKPFNAKISRLEIRKSLNISENALVMIIVANLIPYKGHSDLLNALATIKDKLPINWRLLCVGRDDGIGSILRTQALHLGISENIVWLGSRNDVPQLLGAADIGLLCSHEEGFSNAILEGMAAGLPMVVTDVGGNKEAVIDGKTGYVVPAKDIWLLSQAILKLAQDLGLAVEFGQAARLRVIEHFSLEACINAYLKLYDALLHNQALPECNLQSTR
jgi:glycosyltransferase involved in cell wall biosynthesis